MAGLPVVAVVVGHTDRSLPPWLGALKRLRAIHVTRVDPPRSDVDAPLRSPTAEAGGLVDELPGSLRDAPCHLLGIEGAAHWVLEVAARLQGTDGAPRSVTLVDPRVPEPGSVAREGPPLVDRDARLFLTARPGGAEGPGGSKDPGGAEGPDERLIWVASFRRSPRVVTLPESGDLAAAVDGWLAERDGP